MKKDTKQRILDAALQLFNEAGFVNVRLHQIAERGNMSVGNMAYHFPNKEEILQGIYSQIRAAQEKLLSDISLSPIFENFDYFIRETFLLQRKHIFFYLDLLEVMRGSEVIKNNIRQHSQWQQMQFELLLHFNQARGAIQEDTNRHSAKILANRIRHTMDSWHTWQLVDGKNATNFIAYRKEIWSILQPFFSEIGQQEFEQLLSRTETVETK